MRNVLLLPLALLTLAAATPVVAFSPTELGEWQTRAAESMLAMPSARAALPAV